ncbi:LysE family translocator [Ramlibacter sp. G-1-2-2]|uniref:LysE family translocator n=1 Tax=Ramlibacter agri TaxID=2728837 RepID=A0A848HD28_9BURK|nr:LysE family translocator [Ramlibacter agri]NML45428.1 LysE family translocator [Ramlibacter agri]
MFPADILLAYLAAVLLVVIAPGPDNILALSRGLSQGRTAAALSSLGAGLGILCHSVAATLGLALVLQTSPLAFWIVKAAGAAYLVWLGFKAIRSRNLISFVPAQQQPLRRVFLTGLLSNVLNPKPGLFVVAFIPQFVSAARGSVAEQMLVYGAIFAVLTTLIFTVLGCFAAQLSRALAKRPRVVLAANVGAGLTFVAAGVSILALDRRR